MRADEVRPDRGAIGGDISVEHRIPAADTLRAFVQEQLRQAFQTLPIASSLVIYLQ